jgi:hypothetical protein
MTTKDEALRMAIELMERFLEDTIAFQVAITFVRNACKEALAETQEPKPPTILARLPNGATVSNVYEAYEAGLKEGKAKTQHWLCLDGQMVVAQLYTTPSREWQSLSDDEIIYMYNEPSSDAEMLEFAREFEAKLRRKNG